MKKLSFLLIGVLLTISCSREPHYVINANIEGADGSVFYLQKRVSGKIVIIDSALVVKGKFKIKGGAVNYPEVVTLLDYETGNGFSFYLENTEITIAGNVDSLENVIITGSKTQDELRSYTDSQKILEDEYNNVYTEYVSAMEAGDEEKGSEYEKVIIGIEKAMQLLDRDFVEKNPSSFVTPNILADLSYYMEASEIESVINAMSSDVAGTPVIQALKKQVETMKKVAIGQKAPDFTLNDVDGNPVSMSSKTGAGLLLVDFWAGWCGPCRMENPNLVKVYNEFHNAGFDVFGVSLDRTKEEWVKAIEDDKLTWTHVSDLKYFSNEAAVLYGINAIPANFLLDENGVIIARNLRGDALYNKVKELLATR